MIIMNRIAAELLSMVKAVVYAPPITAPASAAA
jgi:hypothetical protein